MDIPFILKLIPQIKHLDLNFPQSVVIQDLFVRFALSVLQQVVVLGVWRKVVAGFEMGEIALDVA